MLGLDSQNRIGLGFNGNCTTHLEQGCQEKTSGQDVKAKVPHSGSWTDAAYMGIAASWAVFRDGHGRQVDKMTN
jgi:hypothetical protein